MILTIFLKIYCTKSNNFYSFLKALLLINLIKYEPPTYGEYHYPVSAVVFGRMISIAPMLPIPICALMVVYRSPGNNLCQVRRQNDSESGVFFDVLTLYKI